MQGLHQPFIIATVVLAEKCPWVKENLGKLL
jgi:hypothetical protein